MSNFFAEDVAAPPNSNHFADTLAAIPIDASEQDVIHRTNNPTMETPSSFGLVDMPEAVKGFTARALSLPDTVGGLLIEVGEVTQGMQGKSTAEVAKLSFAKRLIGNIQEGDTGPVGLLQTIWGTEKDALLSLFSDGETPKVIAKAGNAMVAQNQAAITSLGLARKGESNVGYDIGAGFASIGYSVGSLFLTKNPTMATAYMTAVVNSGDYREARKAGKDPEEAASIAAASAYGQGLIELVGGRVFLGASAGSTFLRKVLIRSTGQSLEEGAQAAVEEGVKGASGVRDTPLPEKLWNIAYQAMIGFVVGAPVSTVVTKIEESGKKAGFTDDKIKEISDNLVENKDQIIDAATVLIDKETAGVTNDAPAQGEALKAVKQVFAQQAEIDKAIAEGSTQDPKIAAQVILKSNINEEVKTAVQTLMQGEFTIEQLRDAVNKNKIDVATIPIPPEKFTAALEQRMADIEATLKTLTPEQHVKAEKEMLSLANEISSIKESKQPTNIYSNIDEKVARMTPEMRTQRLESLNRKLEAGIAPTTQEMYEREALSINPVQATSLRSLDEPKGKAAQQRRDTFNRLLEAEKQANRFSTEGGKEFLADISSALGKALTPISTRLRNINPKLAARLREFEFDHNKQINADSAIAKPFLEKFHKLSREDRTIMDFAMKNGDMETINEIAAANNMTQEIEALRVMFDDLYKRGKKVNLDIGYRKGFFPRLVENPKKLLAYFGKTEAWNDIQQAIKNKEIELGAPLTIEEKAHLINTLLRGYQTAGITLAKPGALKERSIDQVTTEINEFYATTDQAILRYIATVNDAIETRNFLGKDAETIEDSIGAFVLRELEKGTLNPNQAQELSEILKARFHQGKMNPLLKAYKNLSYIDTMGSPISAITQLGGISYSLSNNGFYRVLKSLPGAVTDKSEITLQDIGIDRIAEEFSDGGTTGNAVRKVFKLVGLQKLDRMDKLTFINSSLLKFRDLAKKPSKEFRASLENIFEEETDSVISDLQNGVNSENVKLLLFNDILDMQPLTKSEMPELYLSNPNGRIFYMLKTFTLKQYDIYRKQVFDEIRSGNKVKGLSNLVRLTAFFVMMNAGADFLKDLLLNRDTPPEDQVVNNIARVFGFSKYQVYSVKREGFGTAAFKTIAPPFKAVDSMSKDMAKAVDKGEVNMDKLETVQSIPIVGKFYYWWFGAGESKGKKKSSVSTP